MSAGKGDRRRPCYVDDRTFAENWDAIFNSPCERWPGCLNNKGYGQYRAADGKLWLAHRWVWTRARGPIPDGQCVLHRCDNPACVRLDHLFLGSQSDNMRDCWAKGRHPGDAKLSMEDRETIKAAVLAGFQQTDLAEVYGVHENTVGYLVRGKTWRC